LRLYSLRVTATCWPVCLFVFLNSLHKIVTGFYRFRRVERIAGAKELELSPQTQQLRGPIRGVFRGTLVAASLPFRPTLIFDYAILHHFAMMLHFTNFSQERHNLGIH